LHRCLDGESAASADVFGLGMRPYLPRTGHDHETPSCRAQARREQGCASPFQPRQRSTAATSAAVWHERSPRSRRPNLSVTMPWTAWALSRRLSRHGAARPQSGGSEPHRDRLGAGRPRVRSPGRGPRRRRRIPLVAAAAIGRFVPGSASSRVDAHVWTLTPRDGGRLSLEALRERFG
jgi:hypothetical protein